MTSYMMYMLFVGFTYASPIEVEHENVQKKDDDLLRQKAERISKYRPRERKDTIYDLLLEKKRADDKVMSLQLDKVFLQLDKEDALCAKWILTGRNVYVQFELHHGSEANITLTADELKGLDERLTARKTELAIRKRAKKLRWILETKKDDPQVKTLRQILDTVKMPYDIFSRYMAEAIEKLNVKIHTFIEECVFEKLNLKLIFPTRRHREAFYLFLKHEFEDDADVLEKCMNK